MHILFRIRVFFTYLLYTLPLPVRLYLNYDKSFLEARWLKQGQCYVYDKIFVFCFLSDLFNSRPRKLKQGLLGLNPQRDPQRIVDQYNGWVILPCNSHQQQKHVCSCIHSTHLIDLNNLTIFVISQFDRPIKATYLRTMYMYIYVDH